MVTGEMIKVPERLHNQAARSITGMTTQCTTGGEWYWSLVDEALETAGIWTIKEYIKAEAGHCSGTCGLTYHI